MNEISLAWAFTVGMVAAVNPCGFPMLPAYLSYFIGIDDAAADRGGRVPRALLAGSAVSVGFLAVFVVLGIPIQAGVTSIYAWMPWLTIVVGVALAGLGLAMLAGHRLRVPLPRLDRGGSSQRVGSMALFGVSYAIASLSCTLPLFLLVVAGAAERGSTLAGLLSFVAYGLGMSLVLLVLSLAIGLARESMVRRMRAALQYVDRAAGVLLTLVGGYLVAYGIHARDPINSTTSPVGAVGSWSAAMTDRLYSGGPGLGVALAVVVAASIAGALVQRRRRSDDRRRPVPESV